MRIALCFAPWAWGSLWLLPAPARAQERPLSLALPITISEARLQARQRSPEVEAARYAVAAAAEKERQAGSRPNPTFSYSREQTSNTFATVSQDMLSLEQPVEIGGQRGARRDAARLSRAATEARLAAAEMSVDFLVARTYATAVAAGWRAVAAEQAATAFERAVLSSAARLAGGDVSGYQDRRLKLEAARYGAMRLQALMARDSAIQALMTLTGVADTSGEPASLTLVDTLTPRPLTESVDSLVALAVARRPELLSARLEADASDAQARLAARERVPTPVLLGGYMNQRQTGLGTLAGFVAGVSIPLPLWDSRSGAAGAAQAEAKQRTSESSSVQRETALEVRAAFQAHQALAHELALLSTPLGEDAVKARRAAEAAFSEGEIGLLEWLDSVRAYQEAEASYATLWAEYIARRAALERATGAQLF